MITAFFDHGEILALWSFDLHAVFYFQLALLDLGQVTAVRVFEDKGRAHTHSLAVDFEHFLALLVFDPEIAANSRHLLAHLVAIAAAARATELAIILAVVTSFFSSAWHCYFSFISSWIWQPEIEVRYVRIEFE